MTALEVLATGPSAMVQDLGRHGWTHIGVGTSGAADRGACQLANRLVGNPTDAAVVEVTLGGLELRAHRDVTIAVTGAPCPVHVGERREGVNAVVRVPAGTRTRLGRPERGLRSYLAVRGGVAANPVLGSRATDVLAGLGPDPLGVGSMVPVGAPPAEFPRVDAAPVADHPSGRIELGIVPGPRDDWFTTEALHTLVNAEYEVTADSDRIGMRLSGPVLERARHAELPSEGLVAGAVQVPPTGLPTLFLADHPVTGGYPVIAVLPAAEVDRAAQARPGQHVRFHLAGGSAKRQ